MVEGADGGGFEAGVLDPVIVPELLDLEHGVDAFGGDPAVEPGWNRSGE